MRCQGQCRFICVKREELGAEFCEVHFRAVSAAVGVWFGKSNLFNDDT